MNKYILIAGLCVLPWFTIGQDIRGLSWGATMEEVKTSEGEREWKDGSIDSGITTTYFREELADLDAAIIFYFSDDRLVKVRYFFMEEHADEGGYLKDFYTITKLLDDKYGFKQPELSWTNKLYQDDVYKWGFAISIGHLIMHTTRETDRTIIDHVISGDNYKVSHIVEYLSKELWEQVNQKQKEKQRQKF